MHRVDGIMVNRAQPVMVVIRQEVGSRPNVANLHQVILNTPEVNLHKEIHNTGETALRAVTSPLRNTGERALRVAHKAEVQRLRIIIVLQVMGEVITAALAVAQLIVQAVILVEVVDIVLAAAVADIQAAATDKIRT